MDALLKNYEEELARTDADLLVAKTEFQAIAERKDDLLRDKDALMQLISSRKKKLGITSSDTGRPGGDVAPPGPKHESAGKSAFVKAMILAKPGITPAEIREAAKGKVEITKTFPYTILFGWKQSGKVEERNGGYYPKTLK